MAIFACKQVSKPCSICKQIFIVTSNKDDKYQLLREVALRQIALGSLEWWVWRLRRGITTASKDIHVAVQCLQACCFTARTALRFAAAPISKSLRSGQAMM